MKPHKIIDNYCRLYGVPVPDIDYSKTRFFVIINSGGASVRYYGSAPQLLGRVIGHAMKNGTVLYVNSGSVTTLLWENWKKTWERLFAPKKKEKAPLPNYERPYHSEIFERMKQTRNHKKPRKHGFERTFSANKSMNSFGSLSDLRVEKL